MDQATKQLKIEELMETLSQTKVTVCANYRGLSVAKMTELRRELRKTGSDAVVVRNTLARIAVKRVEDGRNAKATELEQFLSIIEGPTLVVYSLNDPVQPTKVLAKFAKSNEAFKVTGCWLDGAFVDPAGVQQLSTMPGREETLAMLLGLLSAPATRLVRVLSEPGAQVARVVEGYRKKMEEGAAAA
jgi:large subunit ribosomal protein L10